MSSYRRQWWGAEGKKHPKLTWDFFHCGKLLWVCLQMWMFQAHPKVTDKELRWSDPASVELDPRRGRILWQQSPIHAAARPAHLDEQTRPFIISPPIPELLPSQLRSAQQSHGFNIHCLCPADEQKAREGGGGGGGGGGADGADGMWFNSFFKKF